MDNVLIIANEVEFKEEIKKKLNSSEINFFGYWNSIAPNYGGDVLLSEIRRINILEINKVIDQYDFNFLYRVFNNEYLNNLYLPKLIFGPSLYLYSFLSIRLYLQYEDLISVINTRAISKIIFSESDIKNNKIHFSNYICDPNLEKINTSSSFTNFLLYLLISSNYRPLVNLFSSENHEIISEYSYKDVNRSSFLTFKSFRNNYEFDMSLPSFGRGLFSLNIVSEGSILKRITSMIKNPLQKYFIKLLIKNSLNIFYRTPIVSIKPSPISIFNHILPKVDCENLIDLSKSIKLISDYWKRITISSFHFSNLPLRLLLHFCGESSDADNIITLYKEHGSSFFKKKHNNFSYGENFRATILYRKNYPLAKRVPYKDGVIRKSQSSLIKLFRTFSPKEKSIIFIGLPIVGDLRNTEEIYRLYSKEMKFGFSNVFEKLNSNNFQFSFLFSKSTRRNIPNSVDPLLQLVLDKNIDICQSYEQAQIESSLLIITYPETVIMEAIEFDIPFVLFFSDEVSTILHESSFKWYNILKDFDLIYNYNEVDELIAYITSGSYIDNWSNKELKHFLNDFKNYFF